MNTPPYKTTSPPPTALMPASAMQRQELALPVQHSSLTVTQPLTVLNLMRGLRRCWRWAVGVGLLLGVIAAFGVWVFLPPSKPFAFAKIVFPSHPERTLNEHPDPPLKEQTQKERILSRKLLSKVVARPEVADLAMIKERADPVAFLARELTIEFPTGSEIMRITLHGDRPEELEVLVNAIMDTYLVEIAHESEERRNNKENDLRVKHAKAESSYKKALDEAIKNGEGIAAGDPQSVAAIRRRVEEQRDQAEAELVVIRKQLEKLNRDLKVLVEKQANPVDIGEGSYEPLFLMDDEIVLFSKQRKEAERRLTERRRLVDKDHPSLKDLEADIRSIQVKIDDRKRELKPQLESRVLVKINADVVKLKEEIRDNEATEQKLLMRITKLANDAQEFGNTSAKALGSHKVLSALRDEADTFEKALKRLETERDAPIRAKALEDAIIVLPNEASRKTKISGMAFVGVFGLVLLGFAFSEYRTRRIVSPDEVVIGLGVPIMGTVPSRPARVAANPLTGPSGAEQVLWEHLINESVDSARTIFLHAADANALRVVQITSAVGSEGKTTLSCQLAKSLARSGRRVLLIDGDLRSPAVHSHFGTPLEPGVSELLRREVGLDNAIRQGPIPNLFLLSAGHCEKAALQQLAMDGFRNLLGTVRGVFDFVLIDSSPVLPVADALLMARHADGVLVSLMCDISQVERVQTACQKLTSIGARIVGAVLHGTGEDTYGYGPRYMVPPATTTAK